MTPAPASGNETTVADVEPSPPAATQAPAIDAFATQAPTPPTKRDVSSPTPSRPEPPGPAPDAPFTSDAPVTSTSQRDQRLAALHSVACWAPAFGGVPPAQLSGFELAVVDGSPDRDGWTDVDATAVADLHRSGVLVVAYLSVGTVEDWRAHTASLPAEVALDVVDGWEGETYADVNHPVWQARLLDVSEQLARAGFDGLYLDNLDVVELHPRTRQGVIDAVRRIHAAHPSLLLIAQNGLAVVDDLPVDAIAHEDVFWRWEDGYRASTDEERSSVLDGLRRLRAGGLPILTLDYAPPGHVGAAEAVAASRREGFVPAVSVLDLNQPPHAPKCPAGG